MVGPAGHLPLGGRNDRAVLAALAAWPDEPVSTERLAEAVWGDTLPRSAAKAVQNSVLRLRKVFGPGTIETQPVGYVLRPGADAVDVARFERLLAEGHRRTAGHDHVAAVRAFTAARRLWRGAPLPELSEWPPARGEAARLEELRRCLDEDLAEAELACGNHRGHVPVLDALAADQPLRERRWSLLMLALHRSGRQAEALRAFQRARSALDEIGLIPGPDLIALERRISTHDPSLAGTVTRFERRAPASGLPAAPSWPAFVGRDAELDDLREWWSGPDDVALLTGEMGIGKTRLATEFATEVERDGGMVLFGRGLEIVDSYEPLLSALRRFIECAPDDLIAQIDVTAAGALYRLVPDMARRRPDVVGHVSTWGDVDRSWLFTAAATGVRQAGPGGVLMLLDDVQWASRSALVLLARLIDVARVKVLMTCRTPLHDGCHIGELLAELRRQDRRVRRIALDGLSDGDVGELLSSTRRVEPSAARDALAAALRRRTDGNAFLYAKRCVSSTRWRRRGRWTTLPHWSGWSPSWEHRKGSPMSSASV